MSDPDSRQTLASLWAQYAEQLPADATGRQPGNATGHTRHPLALLATQGEPGELVETEHALVTMQSRGASHGYPQLVAGWGRSGWVRGVRGRPSEPLGHEPVRLFGRPPRRCNRDGSRLPSSHWCVNSCAPK
jgi:hypothetical protein